MAMITVVQKGNFSKTERFFERCLNLIHSGKLDKYGKEGVAALAAATPVETGKTASSWDYEIVNDRGTLCINWFNTNMNDGVCIAVLIQYGHGLDGGGYVQGLDYVNPAMRPIFNRIADGVWKEVTS